MAHIVVIDDDPLIRDMCAAALSGAGFSVTAVEAPEREVVMGGADLILMDVQMPLMDGDDLAGFLLNEWGVKAPVYLFSTLPEDELRRRAEDAGAKGYICKEWGAERMVEVVKSALA